MCGAVNGEAGRIDLVLGVAQDVAVDVHLDEVGGGDLLKQQPERVDEEVMLGPWHARGEVRRQQVRPAEQMH
jgi:hypothetical protein